ncbi:UPF0688 protein C1orf174 homolog [Porphyrio hochstetteri]
MASAGSRALPKMAAGSRARGRGRTEPRGPAVPGRRRPPARGAKGSSEGGLPAAASAQPAGEAPARRQQRGGLRTPSLSSSCQVAVRQPSKRLKCEKPGLEKSEPEGLNEGSGSLDAQGETAETSHGDPRSEDPGDSNIIQQKKGGGTLETNEDNLEKEVNVSLKPGAVKSCSAPSEMDSDDSLHSHIGSEEESSQESVLSDRGLTKEAAQPDNSAFLDEDSNQPMPVDWFFGDCKFIQDLPAVVLPSTTISRREFRKLHFIAKEEEEEEEDGV